MNSPNQIETNHTENVLTMVDSPSAAAKSPITASWRRSMISYGLDPENAQTQEFRSQADIDERRDLLGKMLMIATSKLDHLFELVGSSGCGIVLTDQDGVIIDHRFSEADKSAFADWGLCLGADWSEAMEGTNGIGTCLAEQRAMIVHRDEHFLTRNIGMSCIDAPIYGAQGELIAALDVSSARVDQTETNNALIAAMVKQTALKIEMDNFRIEYEKARIIFAHQDETDGAILLAVDQDDVIIGATRSARKAYGLSPFGKLKPIPAVDLLGRDDGPSGFAKAERAAVMRALVRAGNNVSVAARELGVSRTTLYRRMKRLEII